MSNIQEGTLSTLKYYNRHLSLSTHNLSDQFATPLFAIPMPDLSPEDKIELRERLITLVVQQEALEAAIEKIIKEIKTPWYHKFLPHFE